MLQIDHPVIDHPVYCSGWQMISWPSIASSSIRNFLCVLLGSATMFKKINIIFVLLYNAVPLRAWFTYLFWSEILISHPILYHSLIFIGFEPSIKSLHNLLWKFIASIKVRFSSFLTGRTLSRLGFLQIYRNKRVQQRGL